MIKFFCSRVLTGVAAFTLVVTLTPALKPTQLAAGPVIVGKGAGQSEASLVFARWQLYELFNECYTVTCDFTLEQRHFFALVLEAARHPPEAVFKTQAEMGAVLYLDLQKQVWFNQDLLWLDADHRQAYGFADAAALWFEILAHRQGLSVEVLRALQNQLLVAMRHSVHRDRRQLDASNAFELIHWSRAAEQNDGLWISDSLINMFDLVEKMQAQLECNQPEVIKIYSPSWQVIQEVSRSPPEIHLSLEFTLRWRCQGELIQANGFATIHATPNDQDVFAFIEDSLNIYLQ